MEYTVQKLARLAGVSARTLRYYDEIGLLRPARLTSSGYRIYGSREVNLLQQILFYRELGLDLDSISRIVTSPSFDAVQALREHRARLLDRRQQLDLLIGNVERTLADREGRIAMSDKDRFEGFKRRLVEDNEQSYGREIREKYGDQAVDRSHDRVLNRTEEEHTAALRLQDELFAALEEGMDEGSPSGEAAQRAADLHRRWLSFYWNSYSQEAHAGLVRMYTDDERFTAFYDSRRPGMTAFLRDAVLVYTAK
ncbi:MerR family transcriptional regulator [Paenibacillus spiritus]|uniref:MerR family transcriptional regulator n=1 Tax=Paenibacillus spiritus TaxID=2496557 RepID=A0A5J5G9V9_9BACL|nr:MerR family transcriptional regulator [Paenibacillus spiritus]KAA9004751.1 MerR family transcriptional regulator [Paenibacillus spiritus]